MFKISCLFLLLFCATSCINGGADETPQDNKPPMKDDQKQYKENLLDFSGVPMTQYLAENNDLGVNIVNINLNKASAKVLANNVNKGIYKVNVKLLAGQENVSGRQLKTPDCTFDINSNKSSCQISFFKFTNPGIYTLSFSYDGIDQTKQIFLYVADRQLEFNDDTRTEIHKKATEYNVGLVLHTDLASDKLSVPLSVTDGLCVIDTGSNGSEPHPAGSPCLDSPVCEYDSKSDTTSKVCFITYTVRDTINKNSQNIGIYLPKADIKDLQAKPYFPKVCGITGIELYNDSSEPNKEPLSALDMYSKENKIHNFQVLFCDATQDKTADSEVTVTKANTQEISGFESAILINDQRTNPIKQTIRNGEFSVLSLKYDIESDDIKKNIDKFAGMDINFDAKGAQDIISKKLVITNPDVISFLKMAETADDLNQNDSFDSPIGDIHLHAHQESIKNIFIRGFNIKSDKNELYLQQCLHLDGEDKAVEKYYKNCGYDYEYMGSGGLTPGHATSPDCKFNKPEQTNICITQFENQDPDTGWATVKVTDFPLTIKMYKYDDPTPLISDISPVAFNEETQSGEATRPFKKDVAIMKGARYKLELSAKQIPQLSGAFLELNFGYKDSFSNLKTLFSSGKLVVRIEPQEYQYFPTKIRTIAVPEEAESLEHTDKFFVTVRPGVGGDMAQHKLKLVLADQSIVGPDKKTITIKNFHVYHMVTDDIIDKNGYVTLGDNSKDPKNECSILDTKPTSNPNADKGCWCYYPKASSDANSCNFEIRASGAHNDHIRLKFVNYATGNPVVIDGTMGADFYSFGKSMRFAVRNTGYFKLDSSKFRVSFPDSHQVLVAKTPLESDPKIKEYSTSSVFNSDSFFYGEGYSIVNSGSNDNFVITNFPGKNTWQNSGNVDIPRLKLDSGDGTVCDISSAFKMSGSDGENNNDHRVICREVLPYYTEQYWSHWDGCPGPDNQVVLSKNTPWLLSDSYRVISEDSIAHNACANEGDDFKTCVRYEKQYAFLWFINYYSWSKGKHRHITCKAKGVDTDFMLAQNSDLSKGAKICLSNTEDFKNDSKETKPENLCGGKLAN